MPKKIIIPIGPSIAYVPLTLGKFALIDADDANPIGEHNWCASPVYAVRREWGTGKRIYLHRVIAESNPALDTDHKNRNPLDNRRCNLREASTSQNICNKPRRSSSGLPRGVEVNREGVIFSRIRSGGVRHYLGSFLSIEAAGEAYRKAQIEMHGEFANFD